MPSEMTFQPAKQGQGHEPKIPEFFVTILDIIRYAIWKDMVHPHFSDLESVTVQESLHLPFRIGEGYRTSFLRLRIARNHLGQAPELSLAKFQDNPQHLPRIAVIDH